MAAAIATDWLGLRAAVLAAVEAAMPPGVLSTTVVGWEGGARAFGGHHVLLSIVSAVFDDIDSALDTGGPQVLETMATVTVQITAESVTDDGDADALWLLEQVRLGLRKVSVREALEALGIVVQLFPSSTRNVGGAADDRALSVHSIEVVFCATFRLETGEDAGLVEHVGITASIDVDGEEDSGDELALAFSIDDPSPEP